MLYLYLIFLLCGHLVFADVIYVDIDAPGTTGDPSWNNAHTSLAQALDVAIGGDEIRVAQGTYRPTDGVITTGDERELTFQLKDGVTVKGGYAGGGENYPHDRDVHKYTTILSGDIGVIWEDTDNSYHVVTGEDNATLDGFMIIFGYSADLGAGEDSYGAGMHNKAVTNLTVSNCTFKYNSARFGGGMYNYESHVKLVNCVFCDNLAVYPGGALREVYGTSVITNCTFYFNIADTGGQGYYGGGIGNHDSDSTITNCIFWANSDDGGIDESAQMYSNGGTLTVSYTCVHGLDTLVGSGNIDSDPLFGNAKRYDFHLMSQASRWSLSYTQWVIDAVTSPCIDAGDPGSPIGSEPFPNGGRVNMGAYGGTEKASKSYFGTAPCETIMAGDINGDCSIDLLDFVIMAGRWLWQE